jgi:oligopeptide transport system ATP-binding protein
MSQFIEPILLLEAEHISVNFDVHVSKPGRFLTDAETLQAVQNISLQLHAGETLGIIGESGCGKSTLARALLGLETLNSGSVRVLGRDWQRMSSLEKRQQRRLIQLVQQDPSSSFNPLRTIGDSIVEPLRIHHPHLTDAEISQRCTQALEQVSLPSTIITRYPGELSGGQCQRAAIARALILEPKILICDEPISALDVSVRNQILALLQHLQEHLGLGIIFISHDLLAVRSLAHRVMVMYLGRCVEVAPCDAFYDHPLHPYSQLLRDAVCSVDHQGSIPLTIGDPPSPLHPPSGCVFHTRCPWRTALCRTEAPAFTAVASHQGVACHYWQQILEETRSTPLSNRC